MLSVTEARERILNVLRPVPATMLPLARASGRVLAGDIQAGLDLPPFDNSSVDGFARPNGRRKERIRRVACYS